MKFIVLLFLLVCNCVAVECNCFEVICEGDTKTIDCLQGGKIKIIDALYGRKEGNLCVENYSTDSCKAANSLATVVSECDGKQSCDVTARSDVFGGDPCGGVHKYAKVEYKCIYDYNDDATKTVHVSIVSDTEIIVAWNDKIFGGHDFSTYSNVQIEYDNYYEPTYSNFLTIPYAKHGTRIKELDSTAMYVVYMTYYTDSCKRIRCYPIYVQTKTNGQISKGVYDVLLELSPSNDKWKYDGDYWNKLKDSNSLNLDNLFTNFDNQDVISPFAYSRKYDAFLVGMRSSNMNDNINWVEFLKSSGTSANLRDHIYENNMGDRIFATKDDMLTLSNSAPAIGDEEYQIGFRRTKGGSEKVVVGYLGKHLTKKFALGLGMKEHPYVGMFYDGSTKQEDPMYGYVLGRRSTNFVKGITYTCVYNGCGLRTDVASVSCEISHEDWIGFFCSPPENKSCSAIEECPFASPENLYIANADRYTITLGWDLYNTSGLFEPSKLSLKIRAKKANGEFHDIQNAGNASAILYSFNDLDPFRNYTFEIYGRSSLGDIVGNYSKPVAGRTKEGVPTGKPIFLSANATNSTCIKLKWTHIPADKIIGYLQGYQMQYYKSSDEIENSQFIETGLVTEYTACNLSYFSGYTFRLKARNGAYLGTQYDKTSGKSGEYIPRKYTKNVTATDTGTYSVRVSWKEITEIDVWRGYPFKYYVYYKSKEESNYTEMSVSSNIFEVDIDNLKSYTDYNITVAAATVIGIGPHSDPIVVKTGEDVPIGPPQSLYGNFNDSHSIKVNWSEVASEERKGVITQYLVICMSMESVEMERQNVSANSEMTALFGGLDTYTLYNVTVAAYTKIGLGPSSSPVTVRTGADRPLFPPVNFIGYNTSSTSIYISWEDIPEEAWAGIIGDFRLIIQSLKEPNEITINDIVRDDFTAESFSYEATDLSIFTRYNISIACFNKKGISDFASIVVTTEESVAIMPPPNVRAIANKSNKIEVSWDLPLAENVPGIIRTYTIRLQAIYEAEDLRIGLGSTSTRRRRGMSCLVCCEDQYCKGLDFSMHNITVHGANSTSFNTTGLRGDTVYNISVSVNTKFAGLFGLPIQIVTPQGTPSMSAYNFTCKAVSHSSLLLQWKHSPPAFLEGIRTKYKIYYQLWNKVVTEIDEPYKRNMELFFLKPSTTYTVWITAFTNAGEGEPTTKINCSTLETLPIAYPLTVTATSYHYPHSSLIRWNHLEDDQWMGFKVGYTIFYSKLSTGEIGVDGPITDNFTEVGYTTSHVLTGLDVYSSYRVRIAARTNAGVGMASDYVIFYTCRVPQAKLKIDYMVYPPYIDYPIGHNFRPKGILMDLTEQMLLTCAHNCTSFNQSVYISYNRVDLNSFSDIKNFTVNGTGLQMPRMDTGKYTYGYSHIAIVTTPGFVLLEVPDDAVEAATKAETKLFHGILDALPLCGLFILLNSLFGALFWFCEPTKVEHKGRGISIRGLFEGLYLAVMTSTTVGYGDKVPETTRGRAYIVIWTLLGLVLTGIVTGSLSSAMSVSVIASISQKFPEDKILALYGTSEYAYGKKNAKNFDTHTPYQSYEEVLSPLHQQSVKYALLDRYVAEALKLNISAYGLFVKKAFNVPTDFGVAAFGEMEKLKVCGRKFAADNTFVSDAAIAELLKKYSDIKTSKPSGNTPIDIISWQAKMYNYILKILLVLFLTFFVFGLIYEVFRRRRIKKLRGKVHTTLEIKEQLHRELKLLARNTIQEFRDMIERVDDLIEKLNYKHGKELLKMRTEMSKKYGVNFKYVRPSELGVPLEKILEYKEDLKNKPKETIFLKVRRFKVLVFGHLGRIFRLFR